MNKQIEEIAKHLCGVCERHSQCSHKGKCLLVNSIARYMYETEGYRRQDEVAREIIQIARNGAEKYIGDITLNEGIRNMLSIMLDDFVAELKKKYGVTEE